MLKVTKRSGRKVQVNYHKITQRIAKLAAQEPSLDNVVDPSIVAQKVIAGLYDEITTSEIDQLAAETAASMVIQHPDYDKLASRILVSNLHKNTPETFNEAMEILYKHVDPETGEKAPLVSDDIMEYTNIFKDEIDNLIENCETDYRYSFFGMRTLMKSYLLKTDGRVIERPQYMIMRVALGIWGKNWDEVEATYNWMSKGYFTHATPTLFNSGTQKPQLSSCFLVANNGDSLDGIMKTCHDIAKISSLAGGIGVHLHDVRAAGSYIKGSGGRSNGLMPYFKTLNELARWWDQGGGRRKGSFAVYLEPWHADIEVFLDIRKNHGKEEMRARDLFTALWIPDLFMERVKEDGDWTLMCPNECPGLADVYGEEFKQLYTQYENENKGRKTIKAQDLWKKILDAQMETGTPYMCYKDAANEKSNQKYLGTIKSSNLCTEIIEYSDANEYAVCNLASLAVNEFVDVENRVYDFNQLWDATYQATKNLDQIIDVNYYPTKETEVSNKKNRPIGLGIQGLADCFAMMKIPFNGEEAQKLNDDIFETIYNASLTASCDLTDKGAHKGWKKSPAAQGILQYDMWGKTEEVESKGRYDWNSLKERIKRDGLRNSLLLAPMPTASTAQILGNNEAFEPFTSNLYTRRVLSGEYIVVNKYMVNDLIEVGLWNEDMINALKLENGSIQNIPDIPVEIKERYLTAYEMSQKVILNMAADRGKYICQSQSMNIFMKNISVGKLSSMHFYGWELGLKTGMYYLRSSSAVDAIKFTATKTESEKTEEIACSLDDPDNCEMCSG